MTSTIDSLLHRRTDLSTFLVHLTRQHDSSTARQNILDILRAKKVDARGAFGMARNIEEHLSAAGVSQRVVCFSETPLEHVWMMVKQIEGRSIRLSSYGLVFTKSSGRESGCNPVWYLDMTPGHDWLTKDVNDLINAAKTTADISGSTAGHNLDLQQLAQSPIMRLAPFIEQMGPTSGGGGRKEFSWEREWRHRGDYTFFPAHVVAVLAPASDHDALSETISEMDNSWKRRNVPLLDPEWGLERMLMRLSGVLDHASGEIPS